MPKHILPEYTTEYISNAMNLRIPQKRSIEILDDILSFINLPIDNLNETEQKIHDKYYIFKTSERNFLSLTFALATGVGKTRLMGAFITYLYTQKGIKNFLVISPSITIYEKLKNDLGNASSNNNKYVFKGIECFVHNQPNIWTDDDYRTRPIHSLIDGDSINIYIYNISKFNSEDTENRRMRRTNEYIGDSFYNYLKSLDDLVLIMDESHHYRAEQSALAINELDPILGLELTATPQTEKNGRAEYFKNVVYEYPLSSAINDGYTRTPYALTRRNLKSYEMSDENLDIAMINDGITHHENVKIELLKYAMNNDRQVVKPFALVVCRDTNHAEKVRNYICSDDFKNGYYKDKTIVVHSNQKGSEKEENIRLLLDVEKPNNKVEIVIHVNKLKEGWDVNNLYTIIPLRTATSRTLREQTIGRGLRLPYGVRTGERIIDSVTITAHDKFEEIIQEAQDPTSIFQADKMIFADDEVETKIINNSSASNLFDEYKETIFEKAGIPLSDLADYELDYKTATNLVEETIINKIKENPAQRVDKSDVVKEIGDISEENSDVQRFIDAMFSVEDNIVDKIQDLQMFLPQIKTEKVGDEFYVINNFELDTSKIDFVPIKDELLYKNILDSEEEALVTEARTITQGRTIKPINFLLDELRNIPEIDYEKCSDVLYGTVRQYVEFLNSKFDHKSDDVNNVCLLHKNAIINEIKNQVLQNLVIKYEGLVDVVIGVETPIKDQLIDFTDGVHNINFNPSGDIKSVAYNGAHKSVTNYFKFDSNPERIFAIVCDNSPEVVRWLRPASKQFNITYNGGKRYEPDFVVETDDCYYLVEIKSTRELNQPDVLAKKECGIRYCKVASEYNLANGHKPFKYLFIPHDVIHHDSSFENLMLRYVSD